jgi:curved DNA-binding protein CbpA
MDEFYKILELKPGASIEEIKAARKELLQVWHPDRFQHHPKLAAKALQRSKEINEAYEKLVDFFTSGRAYERATTSRPSSQGDSSRSTKRTSEESHKSNEEANAQAGADRKKKSSNTKRSTRASRARKLPQLTLNGIIGIVVRWSLALLLIASMCVAVVVLVIRVRTYLDDRNSWHTALAFNTASAYRDYLTAKPDGRWSGDASKAVENLYELAIQRYRASRSGGWDDQASDAVVELLQHAKKSQRYDVFITFVRHQRTTLPYTDIKTDEDEAQTYSELRVRFLELFPEDILRFVQGNPGESDASFLITYTVAKGNSQYLREDAGLDPFSALGYGPVSYRNIRIDWSCEMRVPKNGSIYSYRFKTEPTPKIGYKSQEAIYHAMFFDCFYAFRRDLVHRLGIFL